MTTMSPDAYDDWYERRKRALVEAVLVRERYESVFEPGCAFGSLTRQLAKRAAYVLAIDPDGDALDIARAATAAAGNVVVSLGCLPSDWPHTDFALLVLSEFLYYVTRSELDLIADLAGRHLAHGGEIVACHWRHPIPESNLGAREIHDTLSRRMGTTPYVALEDRDFLISTWTEGSILCRGHRAP